MIRVALRGLAARRLRTALTALAIVLGVAMVSAAFTLTDTMRGAADSLSSAAYDGTDGIVTAKTAFAIGSDDWSLSRPTVDAKLLDRVRAVPQVAVATGDITDEAKIVGRDGKTVGDGPYFGAGLDARTPGAAETTPFRLQSGRFATAPGEVVIDVGTAEDQKASVGSSVRIAAGGETRSYRVVGLARFGTVKSLGTATFAVFDLASAQKLFHKEGRYDGILVAGREGASGADVRRAVDAALPGGVQVQTAAAQDRFTLDGLKQFIDIIKVALLVFGGVAILVGAFTIFNALSITIAQRTRELGLLRMVGAGRRQVLGSVLLEALTIGVLASAVGLVAGLGIAKGLNALFVSLGLDLPEAGTVFASRTIVVSLLVGTLVTLIAGLLPAWRATRVAPVEALRDADHGSKRLHLPGRVVRFMAGLLGRPAQVVGASAGMLARRNAMRHPGRTLGTAAALMIGVMLVTLVSVVAAGLRDTTSGSLERRITADYVLTGSDGWSPTEAQIAKSVGTEPGVQAISSLRQDRALALGGKENVNAIDPATVGRVFSFDITQGPDDSATSLPRDGAIVDEGWAKEHHVGIGDRFSIRSISGTTVALHVVAIEDSPVLDPLGLGPITISRAAFDPAFEAHRDYLTLVATGAGFDPKQALAAHPDGKLQTKGSYIDQQTSGIDQLLAIFYVLLALAVIVSLFGIVNTLVLSTFERTRELGMLRAVGMSRRQVRRMVRHESIITALMGAGLGVLVGLGLAAIVTSIFADEGLTFAVPVGSLIAFGVVAVIAGVLAAILPARRAARLNVLAALAWE